MSIIYWKIIRIRFKYLTYEMNVCSQGFQRRFYILQCLIRLMNYNFSNIMTRHVGLIFWQNMQNEGSQRRDEELKKKCQNNKIKPRNRCNSKWSKRKIFLGTFPSRSFNRFGQNLLQSSSTTVRLPPFRKFSNNAKFVDILPGKNFFFGTRHLAKVVLRYFSLCRSTRESLQYKQASYAMTTFLSFY